MATLLRDVREFTEKRRAPPRAVGHPLALGLGGVARHVRELASGQVLQ
jgi:hypothetical protein